MISLLNSFSVNNTVVKIIQLKMKWEDFIKKILTSYLSKVIIIT